jgi:dTDP-3-amino-3,4,6-trideoxy-alpha-D-glucose transaminase
VSVTPTRTIRFNVLRPSEDTAAVEVAVRRVIDRGWFILGPEVEAFEREFAAAIGAPYAVAVGTGTDALALGLRALDVGPADEVITSPLSAAFSALAIMMVGARPVFVDIDPDRLTIDPHGIEAAITPRTRAIMPVHLYGQPADMTRIVEIAERHGLHVLEDACQAHLATCEGRPVGSFGMAAAFSFYPTKNLGAMGDGGAVVTADRALADRVRRLRNGGQTTRYDHVEAGVNSRLDEMQAAILRARLPLLHGWTHRRRTLAAQYRRELADTVVTVPSQADAGHVYHLFPVLSDRRSELQAHLSQAGVETLIHYPVPIPRQPALFAAGPAVCPIADRVCGQLLSLPLYPSLSEADVSAVVTAIRTFSR